MIGQLRCQKTRRTLKVNILGPLKKCTMMITIMYSNNDNNNMKGTSNLQIIENNNGEKYKIKRSRAQYIFIKKNRKGCKK